MESGSDSAGTAGGGIAAPVSVPIAFGTPQSPGSSAPPAEDTTYDPNIVNDRTRTQIAWALLAITTLIIVATITMAFWAISPSRPIEDNLKTVVAVTNILFGPIIALLGSVIGFYFGSRAASGATGPK